MNAVDQAHRLITKGGRVHLIGAGGVGMAGLAFLLKERGLHVSGCDLQANRLTAWLERCGVTFRPEHAVQHITPTTDWVIRTTAVADGHPEVVRAKALGIPVLRRGEVLPALLRDRTCIAVSGTHGKTTTTAMIAQLLGCGYCIGGEVAGIDGVARDGALMVAEADESDGTIAGYSPDYAVITNIEYDHMEHHASEQAFIGCFEQLVRHTKQRVFYNGADPIAKQVVQASPLPQRCEPYVLPAERFDLALPGIHNQWNAAAALAVCRIWMSETEIRRALQSVRPVRRRFETVSDQNGIRIISDYAHHPTEIAALIQAARTLHPRRLLAIFQPHRYTRTRALGGGFPAAFNGVDRLWLVPVYAASEEPIDGGTSRDLLSRFPQEWRNRLVCSESLETAWADIASQLIPGDLLLIVGAGDIEQLAENARK